MIFSGFVTTKVPFPLNPCYSKKPLMLEASWMSSASWYLLNVFGLQSIYFLILGQDNAAGQWIMQEQMTGAAMARPGDTNSFQDTVGSFGADRSPGGTR